MILYQLVGCGLLVQWAAALPMNGITQPPSPVVRCQQLSPVPRPKGEAVLVCDVSVIRTYDMMFYWWLDSKPGNARTPIYTYSDVYDVDEITSTYRDMVVNETHVISDDHVHSQIKLHINATSNYVISFELKTTEHASIADQVEISFEDPQITIDLEEILTTFAERSNSTILLVATCHVDVCFGKPIMSISCNNIEDVGVIFLHEESQLDHQPNYFSGRHRVVMLYRNCLQVNCSVTDERGTYQATNDTENIVITAPGAPWPEYEYKSAILLAVTIGFVSLIVLYMWSIIVHLTRGPNKNTTRSRCDKPEDICLVEISNTTRSPCDTPQDTLLNKHNTGQA